MTEKEKQVIKDNIEYAITFCGGDFTKLNMEAFLKRLGIN